MAVEINVLISERVIVLTVFDVDANVRLSVLAIVLAVADVADSVRVKVLVMVLAVAALLETILAMLFEIVELVLLTADIILVYAFDPRVATMFDVACINLPVGRTTVEAVADCDDRVRLSLLKIVLVVVLTELKERVSDFVTVLTVLDVADIVLITPRIIVEAVVEVALIILLSVLPPSVLAVVEVAFNNLDRVLGPRFETVDAVD